VHVVKSFECLSDQRFYEIDTINDVSDISDQVHGMELKNENVYHILSVIDT
jgi:hypothetical protein